MRTTVALLALLIAFRGPPLVCGQGIFGLTPPRPGDLPVAPGKGPDKRLPSSPYVYRAGSSNSRSSIFLSYYTVPVSRVTYFYYAPLASVPSPPLVLVPGQRPNADESREAERVPPPRRAEAGPPSVPEVIAPGAPASVFRPIQPEDRIQAGVPALPAPARPAEPKREQGSLRPEPWPFLGVPAVPPEPKLASAGQIESGKDAFKAQQYSRAERRFHQAVEIFPEHPQAHFLLAQAQFALGKYAEAVAAIYAGMRLQPTWPNAAFRPRDLYGGRANEFTDQMSRLASVRAKHPDDPFLAFLYAYQLWFDDRKDEARLLFQRAKTLTSDPRFIERFLQANPGSSVADVIVELLKPGPRF
ncbi:MAG TPA: tetratricopeptide repeat protein [Gemmataceae bacterium]|nr:tetratricopeptide repeat protein [Gemmataceae bacterium]